MSEMNYPQLWEQEYGPHSRDERQDPNRPMSDSHPNPLFRPTVQKLYQKLWGMKILHDQDNRVHVLNRLAVELDPPHLAELIHGLQGRLYYKLGYIDAAQHRDWPVLHFGDARWPWQWGPEPPLEPTPLEVGTAVHEAAENHAMMVFDPWHRSSWPSGLSREMAGNPAAEPYANFGAEDIPVPAEPPLDMDAADKNLMLDVIKKHVPDVVGSTGTDCSCGKSFHTTTEWAHHLRVRIWKEMTNGVEDTVPEVRTPDVDRV